jgi:hypothetical protein
MTTIERSPREIKAFTNVIVTIPDELEVVDDVVLLPDDKVCWRIMTKEDGDKRVVWDSHSLPQIIAAKKLFDKLQKEGMVPYRVGTNGERTSEKMTEFDPKAEAVIFMPMKQIVGG